MTLRDFGYFSHWHLCMPPMSGQMQYIDASNLNCSYSRCTFAPCNALHATVLYVRFLISTKPIPVEMLKASSCWCIDTQSSSTYTVRHSGIWKQSWRHYAECRWQSQSNWPRSQSIYAAAMWLTQLRWPISGQPVIIRADKTNEYSSTAIIACSHSANREARRGVMQLTAVHTGRCIRDDCVAPQRPSFPPD